jgi:hypothetical protein
LLGLNCAIIHSENDSIQHDSHQVLGAWFRVGCCLLRICFSLSAVSDLPAAHAAPGFQCPKPPAGRWRPEPKL